MAEFTVPQIEKEPKIVGPFTFKQFIYIGAAGLILFFLYFSGIPSAYFIILAIFLLGISFVLAFLKIGGIPFPTVMKNFLFQVISPKLYIWARIPLIQRAPKLKKRVPGKKETEKEKIEELPLKIAEKSRLKKIITEIETRSLR